MKRLISEERKMTPELAKGLKVLRWYLDSKESKGTKSDWIYRMKEINVLKISKIITNIHNNIYLLQSLGTLAKYIQGDRNIVLKKILVKVAGALLATAIKMTSY